MLFKMASDSSSDASELSTFHKAIEFSLKKLGKLKLELKREQYDAIRAICFERKDTLAVLPTGFGKSLIYQILPGIFDYIRSGCEPERHDSVVLVVSPLSALMRDQLKKLEEFLDVCILQSAVEDDHEGEQKVTIPKNVNKCSLVFAHPEVFVDDKNVAKMLKRKEFKKKVQAIVVDEAHLVQQW